MASLKDQINELRVKKGDFESSLQKAESLAPKIFVNDQIVSEYEKNFLREIHEAFESEDTETKQVGRPKKNLSEASRKFSVRLISNLNDYFLKLKGWKGQDLGKDSKRVTFLIKEHRIWERVINNYCSSMRRYIAHIEKELVSTSINTVTENKMRDVYLLFGLYQIPLEDHERYFNDKELKIIKLCITYSANRKN